MVLDHVELYRKALGAEPETTSHVARGGGFSVSGSPVFVYYETKVSIPAGHALELELFNKGWEAERSGESEE